MKKTDISDQKIEQLFDRAFDFQATQLPKFEVASDDVRELELSELDMLSAAGEKIDILADCKKLKETSI